MTLEGLCIDCGGAAAPSARRCRACLMRRAARTAPPALPMEAAEPEGWGWCTSCGRLNPTRSAGYRCEVCNPIAGGTPRAGIGGGYQGGGGTG